MILNKYIFGVKLFPFGYFFGYYDSLSSPADSSAEIRRRNCIVLTFGVLGSEGRCAEKCGQSSKDTKKDTMTLAKRRELCNIKMSTTKDAFSIVFGYDDPYKPQKDTVWIVVGNG